MKAIPKKTFLLSQERLENGKTKDVIAKKGVKIDVSEKQAANFYGILELSEEDKKKLISRSRVANSDLRRIV
jgi:beta-N-acetylglucosaminidase